VPARELGCQVDVERSVYGRDPSGELILIGEPDLLAERDVLALEPADRPNSGATTTLAAPQAIHEIVLDRDQMETHKQEYIVIRESGETARVIAVVELLSFANKEGSYAAKYREKRSHFLASGTHFMEIDLLRAGTSPSRDLFPELPRTPYFIYVARKTGLGRNDEGYPLRLQDPLPTIGLPLAPRRPDLPLDLAGAFRSAYDLSYRPRWLRYGEERISGPPLTAEDQTWAERIAESGRRT
jgi:hypothetical protein